MWTTRRDIVDAAAEPAPELSTALPGTGARGSAGSCVFALRRVTFRLAVCLPVRCRHSRLTRSPVKPPQRNRRYTRPVLDLRGVTTTPCRAAALTSRRYRVIRNSVARPSTVPVSNHRGYWSGTTRGCLPGRPMNRCTPASRPYMNRQPKLLKARKGRGDRPTATGTMPRQDTRTEPRELP